MLSPSEGANCTIIDQPASFPSWPPGKDQSRPRTTHSAVRYQMTLSLSTARRSCSVGPHQSGSSRTRTTSESCGADLVEYDSLFPPLSSLLSTVDLEMGSQTEYGTSTYESHTPSTETPPTPTGLGPFVRDHHPHSYFGRSDPPPPPPLPPHDAVDQEDTDDLHGFNRAELVPEQLADTLVNEVWEEYRVGGEYGVNGWCAGESLGIYLAERLEGLLLLTLPRDSAFRPSKKASRPAVERKYHFWRSVLVHLT